MSDHGGLDVRVREANADAIAGLTHGLGVRPITARCLAARGVLDASGARAFLDPTLGQLRPPDGLTGLPAAVDRLARAAIAGERIGCFGDYDVDGVTTCALLASALGAMGAAIHARVARREAGYGFGVAELDALVGAGCTLIVTGDCGTSDAAALEAARARGIDVIVIDHHTVPAERELAAHPAFALINPFRADSTFPFRGFASVGLAFYVMQRVKGRIKEQGGFARRPEPDLRELLDLVALGTVADLVPLRGENRILTSIGLRRLAERARPGLAALLQCAGVDPGQPLDERTIGWVLGPRLNAPGRLGDAAPALELLLCRDRVRAAALAAEVEQLNQRRRTEQDRVLAEALAVLEREPPGDAVVVAGRGWAHGVVGIVAAKLVERYGRPAFVVAIGEDGVGRGSARTHGEVDVYRALAAVAPRLDRFGGHAAAAGMTVREAELPAVRAGLAAAVAAQATGARAGREIDAEVGLADVDLGLVGELDRLAPFGKGNEAPLLLGRGVPLLDVRRVGGGAHLKLALADGRGGRVDAIAFGQGGRDVAVGGAVDLAFTPFASAYRGDRVLELKVQAIAATG